MTNKSFIVPAMKGTVGNNTYYVTNLTFEQISSHVGNVNKEVFSHESLNDLLQRSLTNNYLRIRDYILNQEEHFFNGIVLAVYNDYPQWTEIDLEIHGNEYHNVGLLTFAGDEIIFPVDGQHRVKGIKAALEKNPDLSSETISVLFIGHINTVEGKKRTRRIFSTLNRYAKPVQKGDIICLDEDDVVAIATRELLESYELFSGSKMKASNSKSLQKNDFSSFTSLITLYEVHFELFKSFFYQKKGKPVNASFVKKYLKQRPDDDITNDFINYLKVFWSYMVQVFSCLSLYEIDTNEDAAKPYRSNTTGGNLLFRPAGLLSFAKAIVRVLTCSSNKLSLQCLLEKANSIPLDLSQRPWVNILWNPIKCSMITTNNKLVESLFIWFLASPVLSKKEIETMIKDYATVFSIRIEDAKTQIEEFANQNRE
ncbi:MAG: DGQHR domain-containing protein [Bacteroidales bacterium]|nr:DGQHR domain-containing protein [Bacteroidales bacterium]